MLLLKVVCHLVFGSLFFFVGNYYDHQPSLPPSSYSKFSSNISLVGVFSRISGHLQLHEAYILLYVSEHIYMRPFLVVDQ